MHVEISHGNRVIGHGNFPTRPYIVTLNDNTYNHATNKNQNGLINLPGNHSFKPFFDPFMDSSTICNSNVSFVISPLLCVDISTSYGTYCILVVG